MKLQNTEPNVVGVIILGAEGCAETQEQRWMRNASAIETELLLKEINANREKPLDWSSLLIDNNNRPYWVMSVLEGAPPQAVDRARYCFRCVRVVE